MSETPAKPLLVPYLVGFALALSCAIWAGTKFAINGSSIGYGALTGLSFGAMFAFGQRVKQRLFPQPEPNRWKIANVPAPAALRPAQQAAAKSRPLTVEFDATTIKTLRGGIEQDSVAWRDIERIIIVIDDNLLPMPTWQLLTTTGGMRIANDTPGLEALIEHFKTQLPDYDNDTTYQAVINAMGAMSGTFAIWHKSQDSASAN